MPNNKILFTFAPMTYKIGDKEFGVHFGMLFQEAYFEAVAKKVTGTGLTPTGLIALLVFYGNMNHAEINDLQPDFKTMGEVYKLLESDPNSESYAAITEQYNKSQAAKIIADLNKPEKEEKPSKKKTPQQY